MHPGNKNKHYFKILHSPTPCGEENRNKNSKVDNWRALNDRYMEVNYTVLSNTVFKNVHREKKLQQIQSFHRQK